MDYQALKAELLAGHPVTGAYNVDDALAAAELNTVNRTRTLTFVTGSDILNATDTAEFSALTDAEKDRWLSMCGVESINTSSGIAKSLEADLFGPGTTTRTNLAAIRVENISRGTELNFGSVRTGDVEYARTL